jgi:hypothetical protein
MPSNQTLKKNCSKTRGFQNSNKFKCFASIHRSVQMYSMPVYASRHAQHTQASVFSRCMPTGMHNRGPVVHACWHTQDCNVTLLYICGSYTTVSLLCMSSLCMPVGIHSSYNFCVGARWVCSWAGYAPELAVYSRGHTQQSHYYVCPSVYAHENTQHAISNL